MAEGLSEGSALLPFWEESAVELQPDKIIPRLNNISRIHWFVLIFSPHRKIKGLTFFLVYIVLAYSTNPIP
ncbi:hypothetical protein PN4B1_31020 [Paenibacillus naphthalenovorans]|nr:hypothetical protein PN4B1_31020 [Paenibacillus naphthalenovorans]